MSRTQIHRTLPPIKKAVPTRRGKASSQSHQQFIFETLRTIAKPLRRSKPQPFYSMRQVAGHFGASRGTVALVYQALEREGILTRIRGSQTLLAGKAITSKDTVRGVIGVPIWIEAMTLLPFTRVFATELEEHLRHAGYVADFLFYLSRLEESEPEFAIRLLRHRLDAVVMHTPAPRVNQNVMTLRERGIRVIVIQRIEAERTLPAVYFLEDYKPAYLEMANRWIESGIRKVIIWMGRSKTGHNRREVTAFLSLMSQCGLEAETCLDEPPAMLRRVREEKRHQPLAVAFLDTAFVEQICQYQPQFIKQIAKHARVAFCVGQLRLPYLQYHQVPVDLVEMSPTEIAAQLAVTIGQLANLPDGRTYTFNARFYEQTVFEATRFYE